MPIFLCITMVNKWMIIFFFQIERNTQKIMSIIDNLPDRCREILTLSKIQGLPYREIAKKLEISVKTVESQMRIAYQKIRNQMEEET